MSRHSPPTEAAFCRAATAASYAWSNSAWPAAAGAAAAKHPAKAIKVGIRDGMIRYFRAAGPFRGRPLLMWVWKYSRFLYSSPWASNGLARTCLLQPL